MKNKCPNRQFNLDKLFNEDDVEKEILEQQKTVKYDTREFTTEFLADKYTKKEIIIPDYQRKLIWSEEKKSKFIESVIIGLPIPFMFGTENNDGVIEIIDGSQRLRTITEFLNNKLELVNIEKIGSINGYCFEELPVAQQRKFKNKALRMILLSEVDESICFDIFERINTGAEELRPSEVRKGAFKGNFYNLVLELADTEKFKNLTPMSQKTANRGEREELLLRFFVYSDKYLDFKHDVRLFLDRYTRELNQKFSLSPDLIDEYKNRFTSMVEFVVKNFEYGFARNTNKITPRVRFEALAVGSYLALKEKPELLNMPINLDWLHSDEFDFHTTTHGSNNSNKLKNRIEYVKEQLLRN